MSFQLSVPPSVTNRLAKTEEESEDEPKKRSKEDYRQLKELEEARKAGTAPAMKDEEGNDINPHIPQYIMQAPWYFGSMVPTLKHQRDLNAQQTAPTSSIREWYKRGKNVGTAHTKFKKGACENCGATTHKRKDCLERPRRTGAKFTGRDLAADEHLQPGLNFGFEAKRDRWNGYDAEDHTKIVEEYAKLEEAKRILKAKKFDEALEKGETDIIREEQKQQLDSDAEDEDKYADDVDMPGQKFETKNRITVRNLRIREDTAKYLYNLDVNSAHYDPKTRSMRSNPLEGTGKDSSVLAAKFQGDNFVRYSGDAKHMAKQQSFAWEAYEKGAEVNLQADPTKLSLLNKEYESRKEDLKSSTRDSVLEKYGGAQHLEAPPKQLLLAQTEDYVEYSRHGTVIKGQEAAVAKSQYLEDVLHNNHTAVWGSFWSQGRWGYKCCGSSIKNSYCTGAAGKEVAEGGALSVMAEKKEQELMPPPEVPALVKSEKKKKKKRKTKKRSKKKRKRESSSDESSSSSEDEGEDEKNRKRKLKQALAKEDAHQKMVAAEMAKDERERAYNVNYVDKGPTEEEIEAWKMRRVRPEDPMAEFMGK